MPEAPRGAAAPGLPPGLMLLLSLTLFSSSGTIHYQTPMLNSMAADFGTGAAATGLIATLSFAGFLAGTLLLVPLGDRIDKRTLFLVQFLGLVASLLVMAAAPNLAVAAGAAFVTGMGCSSSSQNIIPMVAELTRPEDRGRIMGTMLTALFLGILFGRLAGGIVAALLGWRWMYVIAASMLLALLPLLYSRMPHSAPSTQLGYGALLGSVLVLVRDNAALRRVAVIQFLLGINYGGFWATMAALLAQHHQLGPAAAGLMALPGAAGLLVARPSGRWMDKSGATPVVTTGAGLILAAFAVLLAADRWMAAAIAGAILLDCGLRAVIVANQTLVNTLVPDARSRANTIFSSSVWGGNAAGAFLASTAFALSGWTAVCIIAMLASSGALLVQWRSTRPAA